MARSRSNKVAVPKGKESGRMNLPFETKGGAEVVVIQEIILSRPRKLDDLVVVRQSMNEYLSYCQVNDVVPSNAGFALKMGVSKQTFETAFPERGEDHRRLYEMFRSVIEDWVVQKLFEPKLSIAAIWYLKQLGWRDSNGSQLVSGDNRSVTQIYINSGNEVRQIDVGKGVNEVKKVKRGVGRPRKHSGEVMVVPVEEIEGNVDGI